MKPNKIFLCLLFGLIALATSAQIWTPTNTRLRYPGYAFQYKDTSDFIGSADTALLIRQGKDSAYYLKVKGFWRKVNTAGGASSDFINNQFGFNLSAQPAKFYVTDTGWAAKLLRSNKGLLDSIQASSSAGGYLVTNGGSAVMHWGGGGSVEVDFKGFAGYDANRSSSYTVRSFTDKGYVDSSITARVVWGSITGSLNNQTDLGDTLAQRVNLTTNQVIGGNKTYTGSIIGTSVSLSNNLTVAGEARFGGSSGGNNRIFYNGGTALVFRTDFDTLRIQGGADNGNPRDITFNIGDTRRVWIPRDTRVLTADYTLSGSDNSNAFATTTFVKNQGYVVNTTTVAGFPLSSNVTLATLTLGRGITGGSYNGSTAVTARLDTAQAYTWTANNTFNSSILGFFNGDTHAFTLNSGGDGNLANGNIAWNSNGVFNSLRANIITATGDGVPLVVNSANSNTFKIQLQDNLTNRGFIGANATDALVVGNSSASTSFTINNSSGYITNIGTYNTTVGGTNRDVFVDNTGLIGYVSSFRASKKNIQPLESANWLYQLNPVSFNYRIKDSAGKYTDSAYSEKEYGLIAEEVETVNKEMVFYDVDNTGKHLRGVHYSKLIIPLLKEVQDQKKTITDLEARIAKLESIINGTVRKTRR